MLFIPEPLNASFPSGHTAVSFAVAAALFLVDRRIGLVAGLVAASVAFGRVAVGVHFPSDILGGLVAGIASALLVRRLHRRVRTRDVSRAVKRHAHA